MPSMQAPDSGCVRKPSSLQQASLRVQHRGVVQLAEPLLLRDAPPPPGLPLVPFISLAMPAVHAGRIWYHGMHGSDGNASTQGRGQPPTSQNQPPSGGRALLCHLLTSSQPVLKDGSWVGSMLGTQQVASIIR